MIAHKQKSVRSALNSPLSVAFCIFTDGYICSPESLLAKNAATRKLSNKQL